MKWDANKTTVPLYVWKDDSKISQLLASDDRMTELIANLLRANFKTLKEQNKGGVVTMDIPGTAPNNFIELGGGAKKWSTLDLQSSLGRARVFGKIKVTLGDKHNDADKLNIQELITDFTVSDIYDFNYFGSRAFKIPDAARVQAGWQIFGEGKDKAAGQVFRDDFKVKITKSGIFQQGVGFTQ